VANGLTCALEKGDEWMRSSESSNDVKGGGRALPRRRFLQIAGPTCIGGAGTAYWFTSRSNPIAKPLAHNDRISIAIVGVGVRGKYLTQEFHRLANVIAICDAHRDRAANVAAADTGNRAEVYQDYRKVLDRADVEAVVLATPDHWHVPMAMAAMLAGKDVYCEKPLTLTVAEGRPLIETVVRTSRVFQVGTQQRSDPKFRLACDIVQSGRLGKMKKVTVSLPRLTQVGGPFPTHPVPAALDWNLWQGPAPLRDYCHHRWYFFANFSEYAGGVMAGWGSHHIDIAQLAIGQETSGPRSIHGHMPDAERKRVEQALTENSYNIPANFTVEMTYPGDVLMEVVLGPEGILFEGERGRIYVNRGRLTGKPIEELGRPVPQGEPLTSSHLRNFLDCIKSRQTPVSDVVSQHRAATACHLANISLQLGRRLTWDSSRERFVGDDEADRLLFRDSRPWDLVNG